MPTRAGKDAARRAVLAAMSRKGWNPSKLAEAAGIDYGTAGDFLNGKRWPKVATLGKIDTALGWTQGTLAGTGEELQEPPGEPAAPTNNGQLMFRRPEGLTDEQWAEMKARMSHGWNWEIAQAAAERDEHG